MLPDDCKPHHAAAVSPQLFEFGGRTFVLSPVTGPEAKALGLAQRDEFRRQCLAAAADPLTLCNERIAAAEKAGKPLSPTLIDHMVRAAMSAAGRPEAKSEPSDEEILARINSLDGSRFIVWQRLRRCDPTVTRAWVADHMPDMDSRNEVFARIMEIDGLSDIDSKKATASG